MKRLLLVLGLGAWPSIGFAQRFGLVEGLCLSRFIPPAIEKPFRIPIGCEVVDCCPGCPGGEIVDMRVSIQGTVLEAAELRLEGLSSGQLNQVRARGSGSIDGDRVVARRGVTTITGVPATIAGRIVVASLRPRLKAGVARSLKGAGLRDEVRVHQLLRAFVVSSFHWRPTFYNCERPPLVEPRGDTLKVLTIADGDNVVAMMDSRTGSGGGGCANDEVLRSTGVTIFEDIRAASGCSSEIAIFAANNAMRLDSPVTTWTNNLSDVHTAPLDAVIEMPVSVWIVDGTAAAQAVDDIANANFLYSQNKIGVQFAVTYTNVSGNNAAVATIGDENDCGTVGAVRGSAFYTANALNIYYVDGAFTGVNCARTNPGDGNINYIGTIANLATLAHEIGHAFGLRPSDDGGHTNDVAGFGGNNIMWAGGLATRSLFTLGQAFRMNTHADEWGGTMLIRDGLRPGPGRACPPLTTSITCPALGLDWARP